MTGFSRPQTPTQWASALTVVLEAIALIGLCLTREISIGVWGAVAVLALIELTTRLSLPPRVSLGLLVATICGGIGFWWFGQIHPVIVAAHAAPLAHAMLWFSADRKRIEGWRIGFGFAELLIASVITAEFYLPILVFSFIILSSVTIACSFLRDELELHSSVEGTHRLPRSFIRRSLGQAIAIFLTSALIFPILPRPPVEGSSSLSREKTVGYTEQVDLSTSSRVSNLAQGETVLRVFTSGTDDLVLITYLGLIRSRILDSFDGTNWKATSKNQFTHPLLSADQREEPRKRNHQSNVIIEVIRESIGTEYLPTPYGTTAILVHGPDLNWGGDRARGGQWRDPNSADRRIGYAVQLQIPFTPKVDTQDYPDALHLDVPPKVRSERIEHLADQIFKGARRPFEKIDAIRRYFAKNNYGPEATPEDEIQAELAQKRGLSPLEAFLFVTRRGHCEFFSSAAAVLLRLGGVPTRVIAGFRLTHGPVAGVSQVLSSDAHAWVEAFDPERGWIVLDLTPRVILPQSLLSRVVVQRFREAYDLASSYWYYYVISNGSQASFAAGLQNLRKFTPGNLQKRTSSLWTWIETEATGPLGMIAILVLALIVCAFAMRTMGRLQRNGLVALDAPDPRLRRERVKMAQIEKQIAADRKRRSRLIKPNRLDDDPVDLIKQRWHTEYARIRFGKSEAANFEKVLSELSRMRNQMRTLL